MQIDQNTKISKILKANPAAIEAIASVNKHFAKLRNPILRRILAPRVTVGEAAKIGDVTPQELLDRLAAIGFEVVKTDETGGQTAPTAPAGEEWPADFTLDVRPDIEAGQDPFKKIMAHVKKMEPHQVLKVINSFEPIPLINLLRQKGFRVAVRRPEPGQVITYFKKEDNTAPVEELSSPPGHKEDFDRKVLSFGDRLKTIDVRPLEMPQPMVTILSELEHLPEGYALYVKHKKFPKFLIPELKQRGYSLIEKRIDDNNLDLLIFKTR